MKIFGIQERYRDDLENTLRDTAPELLFIAIVDYSQHPDDEDFDPKLENWVGEYFPTMRFD